MVVALVVCVVVLCVLVAQPANPESHWRLLWVSGIAVFALAVVALAVASLLALW